MLSVGRQSFFILFGCTTLLGGISAFMPNFFNTRNYYRTFMESQNKGAFAKQKEVYFGIMN